MKNCNFLCKGILLVCATFWHLSFLSALDYYWVGGSGLWSDHNHHWATTSGGAVFHDQVPQSMDNVYFDANSFPAGGTVTIDPTIIYCMNMDWTGAGNTPVFEGPSDKQVWIYGSLTLIAGMEWNINGEVYFRAFQGGKTIFLAGQSFFNYVSFNGAGGEWTFLDEFTVENNRDIILYDGTIQTNNQTVNTGSFQVCGSQGAIYLGSSIVNITSIFGGSFVTCNLGANFIFDAGTSSVIFQGSGEGYLRGNGLTFFAVMFLGDGVIEGSSTFENLTFSPGHTYRLYTNQTITSTGQLNASGTDCSHFVTIHSQFAAQQAGIIKATGSVDLSYVILQDIAGNGGATFSATNSVDLGNNIGWTIMPIISRMLYWVGGSGNWNDPAHWSLNSGGSGGECVPSPYDDVFFDVNSDLTSGSVVEANSLVSYCRDMTWTGIMGNPEFKSNTSSNMLYLFGSLILSSDMNFTYSGQVFFMSTTPGKTILLAGQSFFNYVSFNGAGGEWTFLDEFTVENNRDIILYDGTIQTNNQTVNTGSFQVCGSQGAIYLGSSIVNITSIFGGSFVTCNLGANFIFDAGTSSVIFQGSGEGYLRGNGLTFFAVMFLGDGVIEGSSTFENLTFSPGHTYRLYTNQTITSTGQLNASGTDCSHFVTIHSQFAAQQAGIIKATGSVDLSYVILQDIAGNGGATFSATNSVDLGNNIGWTIMPIISRMLYWVGGSGNWNDPAHWSLNSGGSGGECVPSPYDDVFFDVNSDLTSGSVVEANSLVSYCHDMTWTGIMGNPEFKSNTSSNMLYLFGSLILSSDMNFTYSGQVFFMSTTPGKTILLAGQSFFNYVSFNGAGGEWTFLDEFTVENNRDIILYDGTIQTNNQTVNTGSFQVCGSQGAIYLGSSIVNITSIFGGSFVTCNLGANFIFDAGTSSIIFQGSGEGYLRGNGLTFFAVMFLGDGVIEGSSTFENLTFSPGHTYRLYTGSTQTITPLGNFIAEGYGGFPIEIKSTSLGTQATLHKDGDPVCLDFLYMTDIAATGTAFTYAGANSDDVFNNSGWLFEACPGCFDAPALPAPTLDPASVIAVLPGQQATLILLNLPAGYEVVWFDANQTTELYAGAGNLFQPVVNETTTFYGAFRDLATGCVSEVLSVPVFTNIAFSGSILWHHDGTSGVQYATVNLTGDDTGSDVTDVNGDYTILTAVPSGDFTLTPVKNINKLNGITVADVTAIQRHVANITPITNPYRYVGADVNKSNTITTLDASIVNQSLLGNPAALNQFKTSWRFVPTTHNLVILDWGFPEKIEFVGVSGDQSGLNFFGLKTGDVVTTYANPANFGAGNPLVLNVQDQVLQVGTEIVAEFRANQLDDLTAFQFALHFDHEQLQLTEIKPLTGLPLTSDNFGTYNIAEGEIRAAWSRATGLQVEEAAPIFRLRFTALQSGGKLSDALYLNDAVLPGYAYNDALDESEIELQFYEITGTGSNIGSTIYRLLQNTPNPFADKTTIGFILPGAADAMLRVFDMSGRLIQEHSAFFPAGRNAVDIDFSRSAPAGMLYYDLTTPFGVLTKKMVAGE
jgi:hypothetical protein